jgi:hypothetical protein
MSTKPVSVSSILPNVKEQGNRPPDSNRFAVLVDRSRSLSVSSNTSRAASPAVKRPHEGESMQRSKEPRVDKSKVFYVMENVEKMMAKGRDDIDKVKKVLLNAKEIPPPLREILGGVVSYMDNMTDAVEALASVVVDNAASGPVTAAGESGKRKEQASAPKETPEQLKRKKFAQAVREAEKSILMFNLDLGKVPIMNTNTISKQVTHSITKKAAEEEGMQNGRPSDELVLELDDALSMATGLDFFGKVTKPYQNKFNDNDPLNGKFCTMPVKMNFKSKEARTRTEKILKKKCKVACTVP